MKYLALFLFSMSCSAQFSDLSLCNQNIEILDTTSYTECVGIDDGTTQKITSTLLIKDFYNYITLGINDLESLEAHLQDDAIGRIHTLILTEGKPNFYTIAGNSILIMTKNGLIIFEKHDKYWLQKMVSKINT